MQTTIKHRVLLVFGGLLAIAIGAGLLFVPAQFHATNGIELSGVDVNLMSEVRAPGGGLLVFGALILLGAVVRTFAFTSTVLGAAVYLSYGVARVFSIAVDGVPGPGLIAATVIEFVIGFAHFVAVLRLVSAPRGAAAPGASVAEVA